MDFNFTQEQTLLADSLRRYLAKSYALPARRQAIAAPSGYSAEHWQAYADMGMLALNVPEAHGGLAAGPGGNPLDTLVVMREFGRGLVVEPLWMSAVVCANAIALSGSDAHHTALLPALADGSEVFALGALEPGGRYDFNHVATTASASGDGFKLSGRKAVVLHGAQAEHLIVSARVSGKVADANGVALFVVERNAPGLRAFDYATVDGLRAAEITLDGVVVPQSAMLADETRGTAVLERTIQLAGAALCAEALGIVEALTDTTNEYLKTRKQFGVPIGKFQALQHRVADMLVCVEQIRAMACRFVGKNAVQLHGGMGVTDELIVSHYVKRLTMLNQTFGDYEHHLAQYAEAMTA